MRHALNLRVSHVLPETREIRNGKGKPELLYEMRLIETERKNGVIADHNSAFTLKSGYLLSHGPVHQVHS